MNRIRGCLTLHVPNCMRGVAAGTQVAISQRGNPTAFSVVNANPALVIAVVVMTGPAGVGDPAVEFGGYAAGSGTVTVTGAGGASATIPVTITTVSSLPLHVNGLPTASQAQFTVSAPPDALCPGFEGGEIDDWNLESPSGVTLGNFPAMGKGPSPACVFSTVAGEVQDATGAELATKTFTVPIVIGKDNPQTLTIP